jgi:hypothetical protein
MMGWLAIPTTLANEMQAVSNSSGRLYRLGSVPMTKPELRKWVIGCLERIGYRMGIRQALSTVTSLREGKDSRAWVKDAPED